MALERNNFGDPLYKAAATAFVIIDHFLGSEFSRQYIELSDHPHPFMHNGHSEAWDYRITYQDRVCKLADYLFALQDENGFDVLVTRFKTRDPRSVFFEAMIARIFRRRGFRIKLQIETGTKGDDFDFQATQGPDKINVEVTACTNERFSDTNLRNIINAKRKQLPSTNPAAIFCILPVTWLANYSGYLNSELDRVTSEYFRATSRRSSDDKSRINSITYCMEATERVGSGAIVGSIMHTVLIENARLDFDLSFLFEDDPHVLVGGLSGRDDPEATLKLNLTSLSYWKLIR
jgi:hypothetical protein